ncbi:L-gulonolactone oxidase [Galemys pyrenaicus]|uniref:L-gulonolactone oxidase n=1 Tax=Galemys pyrenaicus TaxID=202257 RepID=A0A8J5ZK61_GALPY|nr:L-gulonolactone oxidase [Galemys pyrenaicus]
MAENVVRLKTGQRGPQTGPCPDQDTLAPVEPAPGGELDGKGSGAACSAGPWRRVCRSEPNAKKGKDKPLPGSHHGAGWAFWINVHGCKGVTFQNWARTYGCCPEMYYQPTCVEEVREASVHPTLSRLCPSRRCLTCRPRLPRPQLPAPETLPAGRPTPRARLESPLPRQVLALARQQKTRVKVVGRGHSPSDIACTDGFMIHMGKMNRVLQVDTEKKQVTVEAGILLTELHPQLDKHGLALPNMGAVSDVTAAGFLGSATHNTGIKHGIMATQVVALTLLTADGTLLECSESNNPEVFQAAQVHLGCLGVVLTITLQCVPQFHLQETSFPSTLKEVPCSASGPEIYQWMMMVMVMVVGMVVMMVEMVVMMMVMMVVMMVMMAVKIVVMVVGMVVMVVEMVVKIVMMVGMVVMMVVKMVVMVGMMVLKLVERLMLMVTMVIVKVMMVVTLVRDDHGAGNVEMVTTVTVVLRVLDNLDSHLKKSEYFRFLWFPHSDSVSVIYQDHTTKPPSSSASWFWDYAMGFYLLEFLLWISTFLPGLVQWINRFFFWLLFSRRRENSNLSHKIFTYECRFKQHVQDWAIPREKTKEALLELKATLEANPKMVAHFPVEVRFARGDDILLSPCFQRDSCYMNIIMYRPYGKDVPRLDYWLAYETIMKKLGGRPHWAKAHNCTRKDFEKMYPSFSKFCAIREKLDPSGMFLNTYLEKVFY